MYGCESWTIKKAECQRTDAFELCCWKRLLRVPWTARRSNQSIWNSNTLAKNWLLGKDPDAGKDRKQEEKGTTEDEMVGWHHWLEGHEFEQALWVGDGQRSLVCWVHGVSKSRTWLSIWTELVCHEVMELDAMNLVFWMLSFKPAFSLSSFIFIKRL